MARPRRIKNGEAGGRNGAPFFKSLMIPGPALAKEATDESMCRQRSRGGFEARVGIESARNIGARSRRHEIVRQRHGK